MGAIKMLKLGMIPLALASMIILPAMASAETAKAIETTGSVISFNDAQVQGLWAADADLESGMGTLVSVFRNDAGDIYVVTVKGEEVVLDDNDSEERTLTIEGKGFVARNGILLKEGSGKATITESAMETRVNGDVIVVGRTVSFMSK